jgi:hypothetical protein
MNAEIDAVAKAEESLAQAFFLAPCEEEVAAEVDATAPLEEAPAEGVDEGSSVLGKRERDQEELEEGEVPDDPTVLYPTGDLAAGEEDGETRRVSQEELGKLRTSEKLQRLLRSKDIQKLVREIEDAPDRSAALDSATEAYPELQGFVSELLKEIGFGGQEGLARM